MQSFTVYIDEAGDEGFGKLATHQSGGQSRWLILGACIVAHENDLRLPAWRDAILSRFPRKTARDLHFRNLNHDQKIVVSQEIAKLPIGICLSLSHKITIAGSRYEDTFKQKGYLYNYLVRWLLERASTACRRKVGSNPCRLKIVFSRRGGTDYQSMLEYFMLMRDGREAIKPVRNIEWSMIDFSDIHVEDHKKWAGLQIADCATSAFFTAVEPNYYENYEQSYAKILKDRLLRRDGSAISYGLTLVPSRAKSRLDEQQDEFFRYFEA